MTTPAIDVTGLRKSYGEKTVLDGVDLRVNAGTVTALLGPNGAGKTTIVNILTTLVQADGGTALVNGSDVQRDPAGVRARRDEPNGLAGDGVFAVGRGDHAPLGLGDDLRGDDEDVAVFESQLLCSQRRRDELGEVVSRRDLGYALDADDPDLGGVAPRH